MDQLMNYMPVLVFFIVFVFLLRTRYSRYQKFMDRAEQHMERVEALLERLVKAAEKT